MGPMHYIHIVHVHVFINVNIFNIVQRSVLLYLVFLEGFYITKKGPLI